MHVQSARVLHVFSLTAAQVHDEEPVQVLVVDERCM